MKAIWAPTSVRVATRAKRCAGAGDLGAFLVPIHLELVSGPETTVFRRNPRRSTETVRAGSSTELMGFVGARKMWGQSRAGLGSIWSREHSAGSSSVGAPPRPMTTMLWKDPAAMRRWRRWAVWAALPEPPPSWSMAIAAIGGAAPGGRGGTSLSRLVRSKAVAGGRLKRRSCSGTAQTLHRDCTPQHLNPHWFYNGVK